MLEVQKELDEIVYLAEQKERQKAAERDAAERERRFRDSETKHPSARQKKQPAFNHSSKDVREEYFEFVSNIFSKSYACLNLFILVETTSEFRTFS